MGIFLVLEGVDGSGKSTQVELLGRWLCAQGHHVVRCREPGSTVAGEEIRGVLLDVHSRLTVTCEMLLYMAARAQLVHEIVRPALAAGKTVLADRFLMSTIVYQGYASGLDVEAIRRVGLVATGGLTPTWTGVLDIDCHEAAARRNGPADRIESRADSFHEKVRDGYLLEARRDPAQVSVIDAAAAPEVVHQRVIEEVRRVLAAAGRT